MRLCVKRSSVLRIALLGLIVEVLLPSGGALAAAPAAPAVAQRRAPSAQHALARPLRLAQQPAPRDAAAIPPAPLLASAMGVSTTDTMTHTPRLVRRDVPRSVPGGRPATASAVPPPVSIGPVQGSFFFNSSFTNSTFDVAPTTLPVFTEQFPLIDFGPPSYVVLACNSSGMGYETTTPLVDVLPTASAPCGLQYAQSSDGSAQAGVDNAGNGHGGPNLLAFEAVFTATLTVAAPGTLSFVVPVDDNFLLAIGPSPSGAQPSALSSRPSGLPATGPFTGYALMGASSPSMSPVVSFPAAGTYPIEMDYVECCDGSLALVLATGATAPSPVPPTLAASGTIPWHPHHSTRLDAHLSASVDLADGHLDLSAADLSIPGRGPDLVVQHVWDSVVGQAGGTTTAGQGWLSDLTPSMGGVLTQTVVFTDTSGAAWPFVFSGPTTATAPYTAYQTPPGLPWQLTTSSAGYTLTNILNSDVLAFDSQGRYLSQTDAYANSNTLSYGPSGPISETNSGGRTLALTYTNGLLSEATSPLWQASGGTQGQHITYGFNGTQLTTQTLGVGTTDALTSTFGYSGTQLISVTTPYTQATHTWTITYDPYGRVSGIVSPISGTLGQSGYTPALTTSFSYTSGQTQVIEGAGSSAPLTTTYTLDASGEPITVTDGLGDATGYTYDADHDVLSTTDALSHTTTNYFQYVGPTGSTGLVTETVQPAISPDFPGDTLTPISTTYAYDPQSNDLTQTVRYGFGDITDYGYDGHHSVITTTQELGTYCQGGTRPTSPPPGTAAPWRRVQHPNGACVLLDAWRSSVNTYDGHGERVATIDGRGVTVGDTADGTAPSPTLATDAASYTHSFTYTAAGDLAQEGTPPIVTTLGGVTTTAPVTTSYGYDRDGNRISLLSANNAGTSNVTTYGYDHLGRAITTTLPSVSLYTGVMATPVMTTGYNGEGNVVQQIDANGDVTTSSYDPLGRLVATTNPVNGTTLYTYTATEKSAEQDPQGNVTSYAYDPAGRLILTSDPLTDTVQTQYDAVGNPLTITTGTPFTTTQVEAQQYDAQNRVITDTISAPGSPPSSTVTSYDLDGNVEQVQQPTGDVTFNTYDDTGTVLETSVFAAPGGSGPSFETYDYDDAGNLVLTTDADGRTLQTFYDGDTRVVQTLAITGDNTITTTTGYDPDGNTISQVVTSTSPIAATRSYTAAVNAADWTSSSGDRPTAGTPPLVTQYSYDAAGQQRTQTILNSSPPVTSTLDAEGRTTAIGEGLNTSSPYTTTYSYNPDDLPVSSTLPNGVQVGLGYDQDSRLITTTAIGPTGVVTPLNNSYGYAYNPSSWTTAITRMVGGITATNIITHDALGRLVAGNASGRAQSWSYDGNGNLLSTNTVTYSYTAAITPNEVLTTTSSAGVTTTYSYDQNGDTTGISSTTGVSTNLSYDSQARLDAVKLADGTLVLMTYNAQGQRVGYSVSKNGLTSESEQVTYRGDELAQAVISNTLRYTDTYLYDPSGAPLELIRQTKSGSSLSTARYWYVLNGHGDVVALTDVNGNVVDSYSYDLWGKLLSASESVPQRLRYAGYWYDQELGWYWMAVRAYNPTLMRWLQPDPSQQDGVRTYVYVGDDPVDGTDPTGLFADILYGDLAGPTGGSFKRATSMLALLQGKQSPGPNSVPHSILPQFNGSRFDKCHLLGRVLGGPNNDPRNFVPCYHRVNAVMYNCCEKLVRQAIDANDNVLYSVIPDYSSRSYFSRTRSFFVPDAIEVYAQDNSTALGSDPFANPILFNVIIENTSRALVKQGPTFGGLLGPPHGP